MGVQVTKKLLNQQKKKKNCSRCYHSVKPSGKQRVMFLILVSYETSHYETSKLELMVCEMAVISYQVIVYCFWYHPCNDIS